ncbi:MAG TPA: hypothetical protein VHE55_07670 [Fimbriimonadaceae bacterium]|nr:hypothetical protein [Fimbriimonadaceae bacterium]
MNAVEETKRLYRWVTTNPLGAIAGSFVGLMLLLLIGSLANHALPARAWLRATEAFLGVSFCLGAVVFVRRSRWFASIKPPWLSWNGFWGLALQVLLALMFVYAAIGDWLGFLHPLPGATPWPVALPLALMAVAAAAGIYRNHWWAYFLEIAVLWIVIVAVMMDPSPPTPHRHNALEIPFLREMQAVVEWLGFLVFNWKMIRQGVVRYNERNINTQVPATEP